MKKHFCDLCGEPAQHSLPELRVDFPGEIWTGPMMSPGSVGIVDGTWTPHITARVIFEHHDTPRSVRTANPDLCGNCVSGLLVRMSALTTHPPLETTKTP